MKKWFSDRWNTLKRATSYVRGAFSYKVAALYVALWIQWALSYQPVTHLLVTLVIVALIDSFSYRNGIAIERNWKQ